MWPQKYDKMIAFVLTYLIALGAMLVASPASADPVDNTNPNLYVARLVPVTSGPLAHTGRIIVTLSNGKSDVLTPCRYEDGRHCYWVGDSMGNGKGSSFVVTRGRRFFMNLAGLPV